ncbi:hypothetical protein [Streptococcus ferus]|uniref:hypothetical protein n=1 Tax=Streptococcus ferus TaxID=1345 RepID=UPI0023550405|nr:hypothetical protein [Streptococcus ferus]
MRDKNLIWNIAILLFLLIITLSGGIMILKYYKNDKVELTVASIQENIVLDKTTTEDLEKMFGEPSKVVNNSKKAKNEYDYWENYEGGTDYSLEMMTNYWDDLKYKDDNINYDSPTSYYDYKGKGLGLEYVRFYIRNETVFYLHFGSITNKSVAKKDKYLRQIID